MQAPKNANPRFVRPASSSYCVGPVVLARIAYERGKIGKSSDMECSCCADQSRRGDRTRKTLWQGAVIQDSYYGGAADEDCRADNEPKGKGSSIHGLGPQSVFLSSKLLGDLVHYDEPFQMFS